MRRSQKRNVLNMGDRFWFLQEHVVETRCNAVADVQWVVDVEDKRTRARDRAGSVLKAAKDVWLRSRALLAWGLLRNTQSDSSKSVRSMYI